MLIHDYNIENSILDSICSLSIYPSPHSHTLAGITGNATKLYITQSILLYIGRLPVIITQSSFSLISNLRSSWIQVDFEEKPPLQQISLLVWCSSRASQKHWCPDQTENNWDKRKENIKNVKKKYWACRSESRVFDFFSVNLSSCMDDIMAPRHGCTGVKHVSVPAAQKHPAWFDTSAS